MAAMEWDIDLREVDGLRNWYKNQPRKMQTACSMMLNAFAYGTRTVSVKRMPMIMTVRAPGFVATRLRYTKTSGAVPISAQRSYAGSVGIPHGTKGHGHFSGWVEQETGAPTERTRFATLAGRGGSITGKIRPSVRLKPSIEVVTMERYNPRGGKISNFVAMLFRKKERRLVRIKGGFYKLPAKLGQLYGPTLKGGALHRSLSLVQVNKAKQPKQLHWMQMARAAYFRDTNLNQLWSRTCNRLMTPPPKR